MFELIRASAGSGKTFQLSGHFLQQLFQGFADQFVRIRFRLTQDLWVFDEVEGVGNDLAAHQRTTQRLDRSLSNFDAPNACAASCHF